MTISEISQTQFEWADEDDRFDLGLCFTLVRSTDPEAVLAVFASVNPTRSRKPADTDVDDWSDSLPDSDMARRYAGVSGDWVWVLEEFTISGALPPVPEKLSDAFGTSITVHWDVNALSTFVYAVDGAIERQFELGREADPTDRSAPAGYLEEEDGIDWEKWMSGGLCLQARLAGVVALTADPIDAAIVETCSED
ncbi:hypothetical protein RN2511_032490 [Rhodococcus sp. NKCM2511]|jgi:hypothetical protein|uniref:DUF6461 domain-containing protein n=1 Tax=Nocardiaceae TaxID=85025 RepID=UPI00050C5581|nr:MULTISPECIES: DUF6461 domain-containing protein [Rhodococcus]GHP18513.1 hypothetical protein RN2511_032490 [Rhodococcus sp. NKCM2511]